jgi:hypothetical protein
MVSRASMRFADWPVPVRGQMTLKSGNVRPQVALRPDKLPAAYCFL